MRWSSLLGQMQHLMQTDLMSICPQDRSLAQMAPRGQWMCSWGLLSRASLAG